MKDLHITKSIQKHDQKETMALQAYAKRKNTRFCFSFSFFSHFLLLILTLTFFYLDPAYAVDLTLAWDASTGSVTGYRIYSRQEGQNYDDPPVWTGSDTTGTVEDLNDNTVYYFVVRAYNDYGESESSNEVCYDPNVIDDDSDGVPNSQDAFPDNPDEWVDTDGDGTGNNADEDDDNDGMPDNWETNNGLNPLVNDALGDPDGDGISNLDEYNSGSDPAEPNCKPEKPVLISPVDTAITDSLAPELEVSDFSDPDSSATHAETVWQISTDPDFDDSSYVLDIMSSFYLTSLTIPECVLDEETTYYWRVKFYDNYYEESEWSDIHSFTTHSASSDEPDLNGIPDNQEVDNTVDLDNDGNFDIYQETIKCVNITTENGETQVGVKISTNITSILSIKAIDPGTIPTAEDKPEEFPLCLINFKVQVDNPDENAEVIVYFLEPAPSDAKWYKYDLVDGWQDYSNHATFSADRKSVILELQDGGFGDADGTKNGVIVDPSGLGFSTPDDYTDTDESDVVSDVVSGVSADGGGSGGGCFISAASYGSVGEPSGRIRCEFRNNILFSDALGKAFVKLYYTYAPPIADFIEKHDNLRAMVQWSLLPLVGMSWLAVNLGIVSALALMLLLTASIIGLVGFRGKFFNKTNLIKEINP